MENRRKPWIGNILTLLAMVGAMFAFWMNVSAEQGKKEQRLIVVEQRLAEDREETKKRAEKISDDVKKMREDITKVLTTLERINGRMIERDRLPPT